MSYRQAKKSTGDNLLAGHSESNNVTDFHSSLLRVCRVEELPTQKVRMRLISSGTDHRF